MNTKGVPGRMGELPTRVAVIGAGLMGHGIAQVICFRYFKKATI